MHKHTLTGQPLCRTGILSVGLHSALPPPECHLLMQRTWAHTHKVIDKLTYVIQRGFVCGRV